MPGVASGRPRTFLDLAFAGEWIALPARASFDDYLAVLAADPPGDPGATPEPDPAPGAWCARYVAGVAAGLGIDPVIDHQRPRLLSSVLTHLAPRTGQELAPDGLARELGLGEEIVTGAVAVLADLDLIRLLPPWSPDGTGRHDRPLVYLADPALARRLIGPEALDLARHDTSWRDPLFATYVAAELTDQARRADRSHRISYLRSSRAAKVTIVVERPDPGDPPSSTAADVVAFEVMTMERPRIVDAIELEHLGRHLGHRFRRGVIFHLGLHTVGLGANLEAQPLSALWATG